MRCLLSCEMAWTRGGECWAAFLSETMVACMGYSVGRAREEREVFWNASWRRTSTLRFKTRKGEK